jgi:hypothetical protein
MAGVVGMDDVRRSGPALTFFCVVLGQPAAADGTQRRLLVARIASRQMEGCNDPRHERDEHTHCREEDTYRQAARCHVRYPNGHGRTFQPQPFAEDLPAHDGSAVVSISQAPITIMVVGLTIRCDRWIRRVGGRWSTRSISSRIGWRNERGSRPRGEDGFGLQHG